MLYFWQVVYTVCFKQPNKTSGLWYLAWCFTFFASIFLCLSPPGRLFDTFSVYSMYGTPPGGSTSWIHQLDLSKLQVMMFLPTMKSKIQSTQVHHIHLTPLPLHMNPASTRKPALNKANYKESPRWTKLIRVWHHWGQLCVAMLSMWSIMLLCCCYGRSWLSYSVSAVYLLLASPHTIT